MKQKRYALITGSTSGIGLGIARAFAREGFDLAIHGVEPLNQVQKVAQTLSADFSVRVLPFSADLSDATETKNFFEAAERALDGVDVLVNNAGIQFVSPIADFPLEKWQQLMNIHLTAPFLLTQMALPKMAKRGWGRIINVASVHGLVASTGKSAYVAAKHGIVGLTKTVALESAGSGVTCNAICPGWVLTPLVEAQISERAKTQGISFEAATKTILGEKQPSKEFVTVESIGAMAQFLCSDAAQAMTGSILTMDGGWTAQ